MARVLMDGGITREGLSDYLADSIQPPDQSSKRLIVIEGLEPRMLEVMGVKFGVPPSFFLGHCDEWTTINVVDRACARDNTVYWRALVPQVRHISTQKLEEQFGPDCYSTWALQAGNVDRWAVELQPDTHRIRFRNIVSYWGIEHPSKGGWTAIVLVDPSHTKLRRVGIGSKNPESPALFDTQNFEVPHKLFSEAIISHESSPSHSMGFEDPPWLVPVIHRNHCSALFDEIKHFYASGASRSNYNDPFSATEYIRNFVRSAWDECIWRLESVLHDDILDDHGSHGIASVSGEKEVKKFQKLMEETFSIGDSKQHVREIVRAFHYDDYIYRKHRLEPSRGSGEQGVRYALDSSEWEALNWAHLHGKLERVEQNIRDHMERYSQRAALMQMVEAAKQTDEANKLTAQGLKQTDASNRMARSSGQLTKIATVIVPCSFVASIFSMGDEFAAGKSLFFVYWVISMPITLVLLLWVMYGDRVTDAWKDAKAEEFSKAGRRAPKRAVWRAFMLRLGYTQLIPSHSLWEPGRKVR
ncbi:hypothetical protein VP1G_00351 [Cytospora mali]|uniref:Magnesium transport protein CorA n=1 Tax=Cytospora mali TaxID=578113 RepID=A0A194UN79_CYTMA|nr:hypothetical protein VP1G_00351 [Valsa mali var. pyri (nom. inval.)]